MTAPTLTELKVKLFTDGADKAQIVEMAKQPWIAGFTTNPSLEESGRERLRRVCTRARRGGAGSTYLVRSVSMMWRKWSPKHASSPRGARTST
jgi:hypothetical protein